MIVIRGKAGKSEVLDSILREFEEKEKGANILVVDGFKVSRSGLWRETRWVIDVSNDRSIKNILQIFRAPRSFGEGMKYFSKIAFYMNVSPRDVKAYKKIEDEFGVPCLLTVRDEGNVYVYEV